MLLGAMIVGGWDPERGGQIYGVPIGGTLVEQAWTTDGSGSTYIWGYLDSAYRCESAPTQLPHVQCRSMLATAEVACRPGKVTRYAAAEALSSNLARWMHRLGMHCFTLRVLALSHAFMDQTSHVADCRESMSRNEAEEVVTLPWPLPPLASPSECSRCTLILRTVCDKSSNILRGKCREGMSRKDAEELVKTALALAMSRDGSSGGLARLVTVSKAGAERKLINHDDIPAFWDELEVLKTNGNASNMIVV